MSEQDSILLVEDDRNEVDIALRALSRSGIDVPVEVVRDGVEALEALGLDEGDRPTPARPAVVFLDLKMPRLDGWDVLQKIRENPRTNDLPVVVLSSSDRQEDIRRSFSLGANSFLVKRFDPRGPGAYFADAVRYWLRLNRSPAERCDR